MPSQVFIENHLDNYLNDLVKDYKQVYIPGVIIGQIVNGDYYVVHLAATTLWDKDIKNNKSNVLTFNKLTQIQPNSHRIFQKASDVVNLLPGGSYVLGLFFIVPRDLKSVQPINIDFYEFDRRLNERLLRNTYRRNWNYLLLNYSAVNKKSYCYTVDFNRLNSSEKTTFKSIGDVFGSFDNDWITLIGTFNFGALDQLNIVGEPKALLSVRKTLLDKFESVLNDAVFTFNGCVCNENKSLRDFQCDTIGDVLKNVVHFEFFKKVDLGNDCKNASIKVERGKGKVLMSGLCSIAVPMHRNNLVRDAIQSIYEDAMQTLALRLKMHLESMVEEEAIEEEGSDVSVVHETPRRILILKTEGSRFAFSDYVFPGEVPYEVLSIAREVLNLAEDKIKLYDVLEKGRHPYYEELPNLENGPPLDAINVTSKNNRLIYFSLVVLILAILTYCIRQIFV